MAVRWTTVVGPLLVLASCGAPDRGTGDAESPGDDPTVGNPIVRDLYTADPAALVHDGRLYVFTGRDEASPTTADFVMREWHAFSTDAPSSDPSDWEHHGALLSLDDFPWADANAWASEVVRGPDGRFYWFISTRWADAPRDGDRMSIGVAVADHPLGPWEDAIGGPLITARLDNASNHNIDPTVYVAEDAVHLYWGSFWSARYVRLAPSMTELVGEIRTPEGLEEFWEAPWIFDRDGTFYMAYASNRNIDDDGCVTSQYYACIRYATAPGPAGPWQHRGIVLGQVSSTTNHPAIVEFPEGSDRWWMIYHTADLPEGGNFRRSVAIDSLLFREDGSMALVRQTRYTPPEPVPVPTTDASLSAAVTCSTTSPWERCEAVRTGEDPDSSNWPGPNLGTRWGSYPETGEQWIEYAWDPPVRVAASEVYWFQDTPDGEEGGVKRPGSWRLEYPEGGAWTPVPAAEGYPTELDAYNVTTFEPVTTSAVRLVMTARDDAGGIGALRWKVHAPEPESVQSVELSTRVDTPPALPRRVTVRYSDGTAVDAPVHWREYDPSLLAQPGSFTVRGVVRASPVEAEATVTVGG